MDLKSIFDAAEYRCLFVENSWVLSWQEFWYYSCGFMLRLRLSKFSTGNVQQQIQLVEWASVRIMPFVPATISLSANALG